jgi:Zinc finger, C3HC4 type (RING finger)
LFQFIINSLLDEDYDKIISETKSALITAVILFAVVIAYFIILRKRIGYFYEYLLFFDEVVIEIEVDKCAVEYAKPLIIQNYQLSSLIIGVKDKTSSCYRLCISNGERKITAIETPRTTRRNSPVNSKFFHNNTFNEEDNGIQRKVSPLPEAQFNSDIIYCIICLNKKVDSFFLPCGHSGTCIECSLAILKSTCTCHLCRIVQF